MKSLVIYDSNFGNTQSIAEAIAEIIQGESLSVKEISIDAMKGVELLIVGSPINAWQPTAQIKEFLKTNVSGKLTGIKAAAFDTRVKTFISGNAAKKISKALAGKGAIIITEPKGFYVRDKQGPLLDGEIENAKRWAGGLLKKME